MKVVEGSTTEITVADLVKALLTMPQDAPIYGIYDGHSEQNPEFVYLAKGEHVVITNHHCMESGAMFSDQDEEMDS